VLRNACVCHGAGVVVSSTLRRLWYKFYTSKFPDIGLGVLDGLSIKLGRDNTCL
jgi:hypothetical protein